MKRMVVTRPRLNVNMIHCANSPLQKLRTPSRIPSCFPSRISTTTFFSDIYGIFRIFSRYSYILSVSSIRMQMDVILNPNGCIVCQNTGHLESLSMGCPFCNGTGEYTKAAESYMKSHPCQCIYEDRRNCSLCGKKCHHATNTKPKLIISPRAQIVESASSH